MDINFAIIGAQKSATTWLTHSLRAHNDIYLPKDEIPVFENGFNDEKYFSGIVAMYRRVNSKKIKGIKNTDLLFHKECPSILFKRFPAIKLIAAFRDPVDRAISSYYWHLRLGAIPLIEINEGLSRIIEHGQSSKDWQTIFTPGFYAKQIKRYKKYFKTKQIHLILFEDIKSNSDQVLKKLFSFLEVNPKNTVNLTKRSRPKQAIYSLTRIKWLSMRNNLILYPSADGRRILWKNIAEQNIGKRLCNAGIVALDRLILSKIISNHKPIIDMGLQNKIAQLYSKDTQEFEHLTNRNLSNWKSR